MGLSLVATLLGTTDVKLSRPGSESTLVQAPHSLWEKSWRDSAPQCVPKILLMLFGWIRCGQEYARDSTVPSRKPETIPGCWYGACGSSDPLSSGTQLLTSDYFPALTLMPSVYMNRNRSIWRVLVKVPGGN